MSSVTNPEPAYSLSWTSRYRWNVLDLLETFGRNARESYIFLDIDLTWAESVRQGLESKGHYVTITALLLKAIGIAQRSHPGSRSNVLFGTLVVTFERIVGGVTVERFVDGQPAVFFGEIEAPDEKSIEKIAAELKVYSEADFSEVSQLALQMKLAHAPWLARKLLFFASSLLPAIRLKLQKSSFGLSSLGALGTGEIWGPPAGTAVFGIGAMEKRPAVKNDQVVVRPMITVSLSYDQRVMDVYEAARFCKEVEQLMEGGMADYMDS